MRKPLLVLIRFYQRAMSPALGARCRFQPSCSQYAYEAIELHGAARGSWHAARRLLRCRPGHPGGYDPVPGRRFPESTVPEGAVSERPDSRPALRTPRGL